MYELKQVGPQSYYINSPAKIGIYRQSENEVYLIDSGNDKEAAKKALKIAGQNGWRIKGIINTHSNADHSISRNRPAARYSQAALKGLSPGIPFWSPRFCLAATRSRS